MLDKAYFRARTMLRMSTMRLPFREVHQRARAAAGLTQQEAADKIGVSLRTIQNWESGTKEPNLRQIVKAAAVYGWDLPFLQPSPARRRPTVLAGGKSHAPVRVRKEASAGNRYYGHTADTQSVLVSA